MTQSEYILPFVSILYSLSAADLLTSLHRLLINRTIIKWHFLPLLWAAICFLMIINGWWGLFQLTTIIEINNASDLLLLSLLPITTFFFCALALPHTITGAGMDLKQYFMANVKPFYLTLIAYLASIPLVATCLTETELNAQNIIANTTLSLCLLGVLFVKNTKAHSILAILVLASMLGTLSKQSLTLTS